LESRTLYFPKELSWLAFNERVLQEAAYLSDNGFKLDFH